MERNFNDKKSAEYIEAVKALRLLLKVEGIDIVTRAFAEASWEAIRDIETKGMKTSDDDHVCYHRLMGGDCPDSWESPCNSSQYFPNIDHASEWCKDGETVVIVSQPYEFSYELMKETIQCCEKNGMRADLRATSWHFPGRTVKIEFRREG